ncbi:MAG: hypothetical protein Q7U73_21390 [Rubrivivax sp.]|nr:hypothetical protein [Rubrivivax sp.]
MNWPPVLPPRGWRGWLAATTWRCRRREGRAQALGTGFARTPPPDLLFLQRKFVGTFMLCSRLQPRLDVGVLFSAHL